MLELELPPAIRNRPRHILCLGAHCDDIDIGCGGTLLKVLSRRERWRVTWVTFSSVPERAAELKASAHRFLARADQMSVVTHAFRDSYFPSQYAEIKDAFEALRDLADPDLIFTHHRFDRHQDHRLVGELTWNAFRRHLIFEYEIPKYEGDLVTPNVYVSLEPSQIERKIRTLLGAYRSQRAKPWFTADTFRALMRLRGIESGAASGWAEGFHASKMLVR